MNYPCQALIVASSCRDFGVALWGLWGAYAVPINTLRGSFNVALGRLWAGFVKKSV